MTVDFELLEYNESKSTLLVENFDTYKDFQAKDTDTQLNKHNKLSKYKHKAIQAIAGPQTVYRLVLSQAVEVVKM